MNARTQPSRFAQRTWSTWACGAGLALFALACEEPAASKTDLDSEAPVESDEGFDGDLSGTPLAEGSSGGSSGEDTGGGSADDGVFDDSGAGSSGANTDDTDDALMDDALADDATTDDARTGEAVTDDTTADDAVTDDARRDDASAEQGQVDGTDAPADDAGDPGQPSDAEDSDFRAPVCGDGELGGDEDCDPAGFEAIACEDYGYTTGMVGCSSYCFYDFRDCAGVEQCFDHRDNDGDGHADCDDLDCEQTCSSSCEVVGEIEEPVSFYANNFGRASELGSRCIAGQAGPAIVHRVVAKQSGMLTANVVTASHPNLVVSIRSVCEDDATELACSSLHAAVPATEGEEFFVVVHGVSAVDQGEFQIVVESRPANVCGDFAWDPEEECDDSLFADGDGCSAECTVESTERFFNDGPWWPDEYGDGPYYGRIAPRHDVDFVRVNVPHDSAYLIASTLPLASGSCELGLHDPFLRLIAPDLWTEVARNDDHDGTCSRIVAEGLVAGDYVLAVSESSKSTAPRPDFPYQLDVTVDWCGNGVWGPLEGCDDGNVESGDGCSSSCQSE